MYNSVQTGPKTILGGLKKGFSKPAYQLGIAATGTTTGKKAYQQTQGDSQDYGNDFISLFSHFTRFVLGS